MNRVVDGDATIKDLGYFTGLAAGIPDGGKMMVVRV